MAKTPFDNQQSGISNEDEDKLRLAIYHIVKKNTKNIEEVFRGTRVWTPQQVRLFTSLLNKVVSDRSDKLRNLPTDNRTLDELTDDELRIIAAGGIVRKTTEISSAPPSTELNPPVTALLTNPDLPADIEDIERRNSEPE